MKQQPPQKGKKPNPPRTKAKQPVKTNTDWMLALCLLFALLAFIPAFTADFVSWDDGLYVKDCPMIKSFANFNELMTASVGGNYHPLTMLTFALNYAISEFNPWSYHLLNILLHLVNIFLVYRFILALSKGNSIIAFTVAMFFGVHPMHVESVAWVAERKDVLYGFFFILGLTYYLKYIDKPTRELYLIILGLFILSLASKPAAIVFPLALFTLDFYQKRKFSMKIIVEKIPMLVLSAIFILLAVHGQTNVGAVDKANAFSLFSRIFFASYAYMMYLFKLILPINLAPLYPFPPINLPLPVEYFISPIVIIASAILCYFTWKKYREITFGFAFFLINLLLILQLKIVGSAVIADRYTYIPYIGMFFIIGWFISKGKIGNISFNPSAVIIAIGIVFTIVSYNQAATWKNSDTLWANAVSSHPNATALINRAIELRKTATQAGNKEEKLRLYNEAIDLYSQALKMNKVAWDGYFNRGNVYFDLNQDSLALKDYATSLSLNANNAGTYDNRGALYCREGQNELAVADLNKALALNPDYKQSYKNRGVAYMNMKQFENAIKDFDKYLKYDPNSSEIYNSVGVSYQYLNKFNESLEYFGKGIEHSPKDGIYNLNRSYSYNALGRLEDAKNEAIAARNKGYTVPPEYLKHLGL